MIDNLNNSETLTDDVLAEHFAIVKGQTLVTMPKDLYIPPDAMKVLLETFEGPFDLLLYLIKKQNLDILDIPIADVTRQYLEYIEIMQELSLELAAEYLLMAAILAEIKSRMLLPRATTMEEQEEDPRSELVRRLQEYERFKQAAENIHRLPREERDTFSASADSSEIIIDHPLPTVSLRDLVLALVEVLKRAELNASHHIQQDTLSVREKMTHLLISLQGKERLAFTTLFNVHEGKMGIVVTFLAMLELLKQSLIEFIQAAPFAPIYLKTKEI